MPTCCSCKYIWFPKEGENDFQYCSACALNKCISCRKNLSDNRPYWKVKCMNCWIKSNKSKKSKKCLIKI